MRMEPAPLVLTGAMEITGTVAASRDSLASWRNRRKSLGPTDQTGSLTKTFPVVCEGRRVEFLASKA